jgi:hypothetical protein
MHRFRTLFLGQSLRVNRSITLPHVFIRSSGFGTYTKTSSFGAISRLHFATVFNRVIAFAKRYQAAV